MKIKSISNDDLNNPEFMTKLLSDGSKRGFGFADGLLNALLDVSKGTFRYTKPNERIIAEHVGFSFFRNHFMYKPFTKKVVQLLEGGLIEK